MTAPTREGERERALGAFYGLAIGDALGMPTQQWPHAAVVATFGVIDGFRAGPPGHFISAGFPAGMVTDDTEQAIVLAELLIAGGGEIDHHEFAARLRAWHEVARARGGEQLGPSTQRALDALAAGVPVEQTGARGDTNGAAMRITPVGIAVGPQPLDRFVDAVAAASMLTHGTGLAISGAAAVGVAVSAGIDGTPFAPAVEVALAAARLGAQRGTYSAGADVARRIELAVDLAATTPDEATFLDEVRSLVGTGVATQESVPAAFALAARWPDDPWRAGLAAANLGGDTDTIGAMVGAIVGAQVGYAALPEAAVETVRAVNDLDLAPLVDALLELRGSVA